MFYEYNTAFYCQCTHISVWGFCTCSVSWHSLLCPVKGFILVPRWPLQPCSDRCHGWSYQSGWPGQWKGKLRHQLEMLEKSHFSRSHSLVMLLSLQQKRDPKALRILFHLARIYSMLIDVPGNMFIYPVLFQNRKQTWEG